MARAMFRTPFNFLVFLLSICSIVVAQDDTVPALAPRQSPTADAINSPTCQNYAIVANFSTVALNATYRAAFLRSSSLGTFAARDIIDRQKPMYMGMMFDKALNQQCGNLSQIAMDGAAKNLTEGVVLDLKILDAPGVVPGSPAMPIVQIAIFLLMGGTWLCL
ncbi:hypothetical protein GGS26DRAFT_15021 [Hypomontagnella submonticulosa]|nr:hypothetical protein GGS26DRAFT_15021 [Hypomontagnella submonticulosa]